MPASPGYGSVFTDGGWSRRRSRCSSRSILGENALEPERVSEKLHQNTFWMGRGGTLTHTISGIDIALWDILGKAPGQPVGRLLGGTYRKRVKPYCSLLMEEPDRDGATSIALLSRPGLSRLQDRLGSIRAPRRCKARRGDRARRARGASGADSKLFVDAGASDAYWPQRPANGRCAPPRCSPITTSAGSRRR